MEQEIWKPVVGYEGVYEVSNKGRIKSLERIVNTKNRKIHKRESIRNLKIHNGYYYVTLAKNSKYETLAVHRIVAMAFLGTPYIGYYLPFIALSAIITGVLVGIVARLVIKNGAVRKTIQRESL